MALKPSNYEQFINCFVVLYNTSRKRKPSSKKNTSTKKDTKQIHILCILTTTILENVRSHTLINDMQTSRGPFLVSHGNDQLLEALPLHKNYEVMMWVEGYFFFFNSNTPPQTDSSFICPKCVHL